MKKALFCIFSLLSLPSEARALGRLFFTPQERLTLDAMRAAPGSAVLRGENTGGRGEVVIKDDGKTIWINGIPRHFGKPKKNEK